jgi:hypothetical protein
MINWQDAGKGQSTDNGCERGTKGSTAPEKFST